MKPFFFSRPMSCLRYFWCVGACLVLVLFAGSAQAGIFWEEDWEGAGTEVASRWPETSCGNPTAWPDNNPLAPNSSPARTTAVAYSGTHSLQYHYAGNPYGTPPSGGGCSASRYFPASDEIWMRWYERWGTGMQPIPGTKRHYLYGNYGNCCGHPITYYGNNQLMIQMQGVVDAPKGMWDTHNLFQNATPFYMPENQWVCYEMHFKYNTPGKADGVYEGFATNMTTGGPTIQFANYTGRQWRGSSTSDPLPSNAQFNTWKVYTQSGMGDIYDDLYAVGNTRCGCGTSSATYLVVTNASLPNGQAGKPYLATLAAVGGKAPYGWTITTGNLLPGLTLNKTTGVISGIPTLSGRCDFTVKVMDASVPSLEGTKAFTIIASTGTGIAGRDWVSRNESRFGIVNGRLHFELPERGAYTVSVHDLAGRTVWTKKGTSGNQAIQISLDGHIKEGVYILRLRSAQTDVSGRICLVR